MKKYKRIIKDLKESDDPKIKKYEIAFTYKNGKVYVGEEVSTKDIKIKTEFLKRVAAFTDDIITLIEDFNS